MLIDMYSVDVFLSHVFFLIYYNFIFFYLLILVQLKNVLKQVRESSPLPPSRNITTNPLINNVSVKATVVRTDNVEYSFEILKTSRPFNVDCSTKESYLSPDNFQLIFNMNINDFQKLPKWKKDMLKKKVGLFQIVSDKQLQ